jgi:ADP-ribosylglycohydrolase
MNEQVLKSKFSGSLVGTAVGDAPGAPFQGWHQVDFEEIEEAAHTR